MTESSESMRKWLLMELGASELSKGGDGQMHQDASPFPVRTGI